MTDDARPVIIVGAPRSGTSLMQKVIRETPGFVSVAKESDMIWMPHCHPSTNEWQYEGCPDSRITEALVAEIREDFLSQALSANTWRLFARSGSWNGPDSQRAYASPTGHYSSRGNDSGHTQRRGKTLHPGGWWTSPFTPDYG